MKKKNLLITSLIVACSLSVTLNANLVQEVKNAGLKPIPKKLYPPKKLNAKQKLGEKLFFEPRLSKSSLISCNTCHNLGLGGVDGLSAAIGNKWTTNPHHLNSPTVYNSVLNKVQFWNGRAAHLADQAKGPLQAAPEMASPEALIVKRLSSIPAYVNEFKKVYGKNKKISLNTVADAISAFEKVLITPSRFDEFLDGNKNALTKQEKVGLALFVKKGCTACHRGVGIGGTMQPFQVASKYEFSNLGDFKGDKNGFVKTPTLRNIAQTAPYFHNGAVWNLSRAVQIMGSVQLGIKINKKEANEIVVFLKSLTGKKPKTTYPMLPASTNKTPIPITK